MSSVSADKSRPISRVLELLLKVKVDTYYVFVFINKWFLSCEYRQLNKQLLGY